MRCLTFANGARPPPHGTRCVPASSEEPGFAVVVVDDEFLWPHFITLTSSYLLTWLYSFLYRCTAQVNYNEMADLSTNISIITYVEMV